jgi:hypothetical protein
MNANCAGSRAKVSLALGFKNTKKEDSYLKSATPFRLISRTYSPDTFFLIAEMLVNS